MQPATTSSLPFLEEIAGLRQSYPHSVALSQSDRHLSYEQLGRRADRFAGYLQRLGLTPGDTVALCLERSFDWIIVALGIMRAGGAYVPLDSTWPDSRLQFAVKDSGAKFLVARAPLLDRLGCEIRGIDLSRDAVAIAGAPEAKRKTIHPRTLAYVIYTSGSTGFPKGVEITHANLAHLVRWHRNNFEVTPQDRTGHLAGLGFDAAVWELWPHLAAGATICLADDAARSSPALLRQWILHERITIAFVPTVLAARLIEMKWPANTPLRFLLTGGDVLHRAPAVKLPFAVVNNYGPTECTVVATSTVVNPASRGTPPIGRPITGASIYLLNEHGEQVPDGEPGEIYIGGGGVGRGYRNLPDATVRSFLHDPFADLPGARMYRTGDRGVLRPDGEIEFRGRIDRQTKIRGQRVELDEIASVLGRHPDVDFATAISKTASDGENYLVGYLLLKENARVPTVNELCGHLRTCLPDYMIPAVFVRLKTLPVSSNGKLDLRLLEPPTDGNLLEKPVEKAPASPVEASLLAIARQLLKNDAVQASDNFFLAGGHSLLGMQFLMRLRSAFGVDLTVQQLFEAPTVESLALLVEGKVTEVRLSGIWAELLGLKSVAPDLSFADLGAKNDFVPTLQQRISKDFGRDIPVASLLQSPTIRQQVKLLSEHVNPTATLPSGVLSLQAHGTRKSIFWVHYLDVGLARVLGEDQPCFFVKLTDGDLASLGKAPSMRDVAACLVRKILATQPDGPYLVGGYCLGGILAFEIASQLRAAGCEVSLLVLLDPPSSAFIKRYARSPRLSDPVYLLRRVTRLGPRLTFLRLRQHFLEYWGWSSEVRNDGTEVAAPPDQVVIERAAFKYSPEKYDGKVLLLLATDHSSHVNFLPGWQAVIPGDLHVEHLNAHHDDLMIRPTVERVANSIVAHVGLTGSRS
jgi:amino acid adenylation domain-containing protein